MPVIGTDRLVALQHSPNEIRNICILAHVDHGKTSLADSLIATNGIISSKLAGKIRYLDSRPDEQLRGITMESSAISLYFSMMRRPDPEADLAQKEYLINLIDSPGHIDFSSEVSTASRLCDGALVLIDAVEGIQSQTITVLRQTWIERLKPLLVINKMDRLITELRMSATEAFAHLSQLIEQVNAIIGSFFQGERMEEDLQWRERMDERVAKAAAKEQEKTERKAAQSNSQSLTDEYGNIDSTASNDEFPDKDDEELYFAPEKQNVIFSSALDGWAFTVRQFAHLYEKKIGLKSFVLEKVLWGDFYLDPKTKRVLSSKHLKGRHLKPMFVQLVLENIWAVYEATSGGDKGRGDHAMMEKIIKSLSLKIPTHVLRSRDPRAILTTVFSSWLPISTAVLVSVIEHLPSPPSAQADRLPKIIEDSPGGQHVDQRLKDAMTSSKPTPGEPMVAYVSKMVAVRESELPHDKRKGGGTMTGEEARDLARKKRAEIEKVKAVGVDTSNNFNGITETLDNTVLGDEAEAPDDPEHLIGFSRLYSGSLSIGDSVYVLSPKFTPANPYAIPEPRKVTITGLYLMMGRGLESLSVAPAGSVVGIAGLQGHILKSGTLSSQLEGSVNLAGISMGGQPIVRVALEPLNPADLDKMIAGLKLLEQSDSCARYETMDSGEHVILTAGEVHLERCLNDLQERLAKCEIQAGEPIIPYRETIVNAEEMRPPRDTILSRGTVVGVTSSKQVTIRLRVHPVPASVVQVLEKNEDNIRSLYAQKQELERREDVREDELEDNDIKINTEPSVGKADLMTAVKLREELKAAIVEARQPGLTPDMVDKIIAFGPRRVGPNILIDETTEGLCEKFLHETHLDHNSPSSEHNNASASTNNNQTTLLTAHDLLPKFLHAFQLATHSGPLCHEPLSGTLTLLESLTLTSPAPSISSLPRLTGEIIRTTLDSLSAGFLDWSPRLLLAMYSCEIQAHTSVLGRVYATLAKHNATILSETLPPNSAETYLITSLLPIASSFGFSSALLTATSGHASPPQLVFSGFRMLDEDPFWVPRTEEELEDFGEKAERENRALKVMESVRVRKGMQSKRVATEGGREKTLKR